MFRVIKGKSMMRTKKIVVVFVLLIVLNLQSSSVLISQGVELSTYKSQASDRVLTLTNQVNEASEERFNVTLWIRDWKNKTSFRNLNVTLFDLKGHLASSYFSNVTGHVPLKLLPGGFYVVSVQNGNRTVGYEEIEVNKSSTIMIRTWSYDLNLTLVDKDWKPLANHTVFLYDQMIFQAPNYTMREDQVLRNTNYTVITEETNTRRLVNQNETNINGTVSFTGVWNGTYRIRVFKKETWIEEYILGELVRIRQPPVLGEHVLFLQEPTNATLKCVKADLTLKFNTESNVPVQNATVYVRNRSGHLYIKDFTNKTGFIEYKNIYVINNELYAVSALYGNRTVSYKVINAAETGPFSVKVWAYNLTVTTVNQEGKPLPNHVVFLNDQLVFHSPTNITILATNQTGPLSNWTKTDENGTARFMDVWNGTYRIRVAGGELVGEEIINLQRHESLSIKGNKTYLELTFVTGSDEPLSNATIYIYNSVGRLVFRDYTDLDGRIRHDGIYLDNYRVVAEWMGTQVWSGIVNVSQDRERLKTEPIETSVFRLTLQFVDPFGNALPKAALTMRKMMTTRRYIDIGLELKTDERGYYSSLLPSGVYEVSSSYGIYSGTAVVNLVDNYEGNVRCDVQLNAWLLTIFVSSPLVGLTLLLERRRLRKPMEIRRYKNMLLKLESMYRNGQVEYRLYRRLREEYEAKLMELGGREMR